MKRGKQIIVFIAVCLLIFPLISAGLVDWLKGLTGKATEDTVDINISVTGSNAPTITVDNDTMNDGGINDGPDEGSSTTTMVINFTVYDADGFNNINPSSAQINLSMAGETPRTNTSCVNTNNYSLYYSDFTCTVVMAWFDGAGTWTINATASDDDANNAENSTTTFYIGTTNAFVMSPTTLTWASINAGATNQEPNEFILMNNTGNVDKYVEVNTTNLRGETNSTLALWATNFTVRNVAGCEGTAMVPGFFTNVTSTTLPAGNFTINDGSSGQEEVYVCLEQAGSELTAQAYSTDQEGDWTFKIVTQ